MKANKKTLMVVKQLLELQEGWDLNELIEEMVAETKLLKHKEMGENTLYTDECSINWGEDEICVLQDFINSYTNIFIDKFCNILDSFVGEDLNCYLGEDEE